MFLRGKIGVAGAVAGLLLGLQAGVNAITLDITDTDSIKSAASNIAYEMMTYYKGNETGGTPGLLEPPYYWWEAGAMWGLLIEYWYMTGDSSYNDVVSQGILFQVGDNNFMPPNQTADLGNDDQVFWAFTAMTAAELNFPAPPTGQPSWLALAQAVFNLVSGRWDTSSCGGGLRWQIYSFNAGYDYKNTIATGGFFQLAARLARYTGNSTYADWAEKTWDWMQAMPLLTSTYQVWDGVSVSNNCSNADQIYWTYNVGTLLSGASFMYNYTNGSALWEQRIYGLLNGTEVFFRQPSGSNSPPVTPAANGFIMAEVACEFPVAESCDYDQPSFKTYLGRWMALSTQMAPFTASYVMPRIQASAQAAAQQCTGTYDGSTSSCGRRWYQNVWDGFNGVGEQMSALSIIQSNLITKVNPPVTAMTGGTSKSDPSAGTGSDAGNAPPSSEVDTEPIGTGDRAGAGILTALTLVLVFARAATTGRLTSITSSSKKRKLSKPDIVEPPGSTVDYHQNPPSSPGSQTTQASSPPPVAPLDNTTHFTTSPSPPRPIPPHLITQGAGRGRSITPEVSSTAASSPSAVYAGLTLDSENRWDHSGSDNGKAYDDTRLHASRNILETNAAVGRSTSPGKRRRLDMDEATDIIMDAQHVQDVDMEHSQPTTETSEPVNGESQTTETKGTPKDIHAEGSGRHERGTSVMMETSSPEPAQYNTAMDDGNDAPLPGAYLTPQSGITSASPTTTAATSKQAFLHPTSMGSGGADTKIPSIDEQIEQVMKLALAPPKEGQKGYLVLKSWLDRVLSKGSDTQKKGTFSKTLTEGPVGPVDNSGMNMVLDASLSNLEDEAGEKFILIKPGLQINDDFEVLPQEAWDLIIKWYGLAQASPIITRYCHNTSTNNEHDNIQYELFPPIFTILKLPDRSAGMTKEVLQEKDKVPGKIVASRNEVFQKFLKRAKNMAGISTKTRTRVWRILGGLGGASNAGMLTPAQSRSASPAPNSTLPVDSGKSLVLDVNTFAALQQGSQRELIDAKDETMNDNYNGHSNLGFYGLAQDEVIVIEEQIGGPAGGEWVSDSANTHAVGNGVSISVTKNGSTALQNTLKPKANNASGRTSPAPTTGGMMTRGRAQRNGRVRGTIGLSNLGNTCYMNSALQCVRSVEELTQYFLNNHFKHELNPRNPLGHNGDVAKAYAALLNELYSEHAFSSLSPRHFKQIIGKYGPSFSGYGQQDSQEFLLFLLDGLQEDLNRVKQKPYIEKPDSTDEMVNDSEALRKMADTCWNIYKARNDSVITDLFAGMYKSTVVCPVCNKVSIIFDPFNNLTLQLPIENVWTRDLTFYPLYKPPIKISVDIDKNATFYALKDFVGNRVGVDSKQLVVAEIYKCKFFKMFKDNMSISEERISDTDDIAIYELEQIPTNFPPPKKKVQKQRSMLSYHQSDEDEDLPEGESPLDERMMVSVFSRVSKEGSSRNQQKIFFGVPQLIVLTREEARDYDSVLKKCLAKVATMTTMDILKTEDEIDEVMGQEDSDAVMMTADDMDSSSDTKVQGTSVQSEDGIVDISMRDVKDEARTGPRISYPPQDHLTKRPRIPNVLKPGSFIPPELTNLFQMKYHSGSDMVPVGWSSFQDESKNFPDLTSRLSRVRISHRPRTTTQSASAQLAQRSQHVAASGSISSDEDADAEDVPELETHQTPESVDESDDEGLPEVQDLMKQVHTGPSSTFNRKNGRNNSGLITYSRKGKCSTARTGFDGYTSDIDQDDGPLLRLGEALILDWTPQAYDSLFTDGPEENGMRGNSTWDNLPLLTDPVQDEKRRIRKSRKKDGVSLGDCLDEFGKAEILSENDAWYCPRCKEHRRASKKFELWKSPDILVIHLKRFSNQGRLRDKLDVFVDFPVEGLDLSSRVVVQEEGKSPIYDLFAVDNHYGGLGGGHYTAFARNFFSGDWYEYNDSQASRRSNPQHVVTSAAYLLFYRRRSPKPLGGPYFEQILQEANDASNEEIESQPQSRTTSPNVSGEGKRLDGSSRNGLSSALLGVGAVHQAGSGGLAGGMMGTRNVDEDYSPPRYSEDLPQGEQTLESMELDSMPNSYQQISSIGLYPQATWGFSTLARSDDGEASHDPMLSQAPAGSEEELAEDNFFGDDVSSNRAEPSMGSSDGLDDRNLDDLPAARFGTPVSDMHGQEYDDESMPPLQSSPDPLTLSRLTAKRAMSYTMDVDRDEETAEIRLDDDPLDNEYRGPSRLDDDDDDAPV